MRRARSDKRTGNCCPQGVPTVSSNKQSAIRTLAKSVGTIGDSSLYLDYSETTFNRNATECKFHLESPERRLSPQKISVPRSMSSDATGSTATSEECEQRFLKPTTPLLMLAQQHKWRDIYDLLRRRDTKYDLKTWLCECTNRHSGQTALHLVIKYKPPCSIVALIIRHMRKFDKISDPQSISDKFGTTPLHIAVAVGSKVKVIEELLCGRYAPKTNPAAIADSSDRYPLHMACSKQVIGLQSLTVGAQIIGILATAYPAAIFLQDREGWTPKFMLHEYAYHHAMAKALVPAEIVLMRQHGGNLNDLINAVNAPPIPLATTGILVDPNDQNSVSSIGWDEDKYGILHEVPASQTFIQYGREGSFSITVSQSVTETEDTSCTGCTNQNVVSHRRSYCHQRFI